MSKNLDTLASALASGRARVSAPKPAKPKPAKRTAKKLPRKAKKSASQWRAMGPEHARHWGKTLTPNGFAATVHAPSPGDRLPGFHWVLEDPDGSDIGSGREPTRKGAERAALAEWKAHSKIALGAYARKWSR
jgi:hypothetical protein